MQEINIFQGTAGPRAVKAFLCFITLIIKIVLDMFTKNDTVERLFEVYGPYLK